VGRNFLGCGSFLFGVRVVKAFALVATVAGLSAGSSASAARWTLQRVPIPAGAVSADLESVSCVSARACTAVGSSQRRRQASRALAERWDGSKWRIERLPTPIGGGPSSLDSVSCSSPAACTAVGTPHGDGGLLAERWNGRAWSIEPTPTLPYASFSAVSCPAKRVRFAVGDSGGYDDSELPISLTARWNGSAWSAQPSGEEEGLLYGVSCASRTFCAAVGGVDTDAGSYAVAETWNGAEWTDHPLSAGEGNNDLARVSCSSPRACIAIGDQAYNANSSPLVMESWNGRDWSVLGTSPDLDAVSCTSRSACIGVSGDAPGAGPVLRWNGRNWSSQKTPRAADGNLADVSCVSASRCVAVGAGPRAPIAIRYG
jgi:hypothetical protein